MIKAVFVAGLAYASSNIAGLTISKYLLTPTFAHHNLLALVQSTFICCLLLASKGRSLILFCSAQRHAWRAWLSVGIAFSMMISSSFYALQLLTTAQFMILKRANVMVVAFGEMLFWQKRITVRSWLSFMLIILAAAISAHDHLHEPIEVKHRLGLGIIAMTTNILSTSAFSLLLKANIQKLKLEDHQTLLMNNLISVPVLLTMALIFEDVRSSSISRDFVYETRSTPLASLILLLLLCISTSMIGYTTTMLLRCTSATTVSFVGALAKAPLALTGVIFFDEPFTIQTQISIVLNMISAILYCLQPSLPPILPTSVTHTKA